MLMTIFEKIISREIPANIVYEDSDVIAFRDIDPQAPVHIVIASKSPIPTLNDITEADAGITGKMVMAAQKIAQDEKIDQSGYRIVFNCNKDGGQSVDHIHCHLLGGRQMKWPPG
jgi:histidine triad (HIT) family protein